MVKLKMNLFPKIKCNWKVFKWCLLQNERVCTKNLICEIRTITRLRTRVPLYVVQSSINFGITHRQKITYNSNLTELYILLIKLIRLKISIH